jgi:membrane-anchored protein YejM (alkaline phosphatase superfamily)
MAKKITLAILIISFAIGCIGSWFEVFDMDAFTKFLIHFSPFYLGLIASIGTNSAIEKVKKLNSTQ